VAKDAHYFQPSARGQASPVVRLATLEQKTGRGNRGLPARSSRAAVDDADGSVGLDDYVLGLVDVCEAGRTQRGHEFVVRDPLAVHGLLLHGSITD